MDTKEKALALPTSGDPEEWTPDEKAFVAAAGLMKKVKGQNGKPDTFSWAPRPTVVAFFAHCKRTGLDPIARQIYAIERGGEWGIQVSIDGFRLVAQRSGHYAGQKPVEWTADGVTWTDVWVADVPPLAARATVLRDDFDEPMVATARYASYVVVNEEWAYNPEKGKREKTGKSVPGPMWGRMPEVMIAKVAEALALRKAFPQELSGLYTDEEMDQATVVVVDEATPPSRRSRIQRPVDSPSDEGVEPPVDAELVEEGSTEPEVVPVAQAGAERRRGSGPLCSECGLEPVQDEGNICGPCEGRILAAEEEGTDG